MQTKELPKGVDRLVTAHGADRIGIYAPLRRQTVSWSFETVSNADFKTVTPSHCEPAWEVIRADGTGTGALAMWWLKAMRGLGASRFLVRVDIHDDTDLNLCAELVEQSGACLWLTPLANPEADLLPWIQFGQARNLVIPNSEHYDEAAMLALCQALEPAMEVVA